jgi:hypothetical protein
MNNINEPLHYGSIQGGSFDKEVQEEFEAMQKEAARRGTSGKLTITIVVKPPDAGDFAGAMGYSVDASYGKRPTKAKATLVNPNTGVIYSDSLRDPRQGDLLIDEPEVGTTFAPRSGTDDR